MKAINLFFDMEFTSLSPDAQVISLGIVSEDIMNPDNLAKEWLDSDNPYMPLASELLGKSSKSFYAEFTDFDTNRCDDWVKENVVGKLKYHNYEYPKIMPDNIVANIIDFKDMGRGTIFQHEQTNETDLRVFHDSSPELFGNTTFVKTVLKEWLKQFSDYQITFVKDAQSTKGTGLDWLNLVELIRIDNLPKDWSYIKLTRNYLVMVDRDKHDELSKFKWYSVISESNPLNCYAAYKINGKVVKMHRYLMGDPPFVGACVDHINGNSLDNRVSNLRWVTPRQNNMNVRPSKSKCKFKGVCFRGQINKYEARITDNGKTVTIGYYDTEIEAAKAYNKKSIEVFGEYARPNQLDNFPKLPSNISPVPLDLNDLIAFKLNISAREAFDWNREEMAYSESFNPKGKAEHAKYMQGDKWGDEKHQSLWDAKVIKAIYEKLL